MDIILYTNTSSPIVVNKTLVERLTTDFDLKAATSIQNPTILLKGANISTLANVNYCYIPEFKRYYFLNTPTLLSGGLFMIEGKVDVLMSFKDQIKKNSAICSRQERNPNFYISDSRMQRENRDIINSYNFSSGFSDISYILTVIGGVV